MTREVPVDGVDGRLRRVALPAALALLAVIGTAALAGQLDVLAEISLALLIGVVPGLFVLRRQLATRRAVRTEPADDEGGRRLPVPDRDPIAPLDLPPPPPVFTGRAQQLDEIRAHLDVRDPGPQIVGITGAAGTGKTALALHVAHTVRGDYPGGCLFTSLRRSAAEGQPSRDEILGHFVRALRGPRDPVRSDLAASYRELSERAGPILVVLDDVRDVDWVADLVPTSAGSAVLMASRRPLQQGPARTLEVEVGLLAPADGARLVSEIIRTGWQTEVTPADAAAVVDGRAHLPLELTLAGTSLALGPYDDLAAAVRRLGESVHSRGTTIVLASTDRQRADSAADDVPRLDLAYAQLPELHQKVLRWLGRRDTPEFAPWMITAVERVVARTAWHVAGKLADRGLVERTLDGTYGLLRFRLRDGVWEYARQLPLRDDDPTPDHVATDLAGAEPGRDESGSYFSAGSVFTALHEGDPVSALFLAQDALAIAIEQADSAHVGLALAALAEVHSELGNVSEADRFAERATEVGAEHELVAVHVRGLRCRALAQRRHHRLLAAERSLNNALDVLGDSDPSERIRILRDRAFTLALAGRPEQARQDVEEALRLCKAARDGGKVHRPGVLRVHAEVLARTDRRHRAAELLVEARSLAEEQDLRLWIGWIDRAIGELALSMGDVATAEDAARRGVSAFARMHLRYGMAQCRLLAGDVLANVDPEKAALAFEEALETFLTCGDMWLAGQAGARLDKLRQPEPGSGVVTLRSDTADLAMTGVRAEVR